MKKTLLLPLFAFFIVLYSCVPVRMLDESQQEVARLEGELEYLRSRCEIIGDNSGTDDGIPRSECPEKKLYASITSIQASRSNQSITVNFQVLNRGANLSGTSVADRTGNTRRGTKLIYNGQTYQASSVTYAGSVGGYGDLMTDTPLKGSMTFSGILPESSQADYISFNIRGMCELGFNNVSLNWKR